MNFVFLALLMIGAILVFVVSSVGGKFVVAGCLLVVMTVDLVLRFTYFRNVLPELREERERRRLEEWPPAS